MQPELEPGPATVDVDVQESTHFNSLQLQVQLEVDSPELASEVQVELFNLKYSSYGVGYYY